MKLALIVLNVLQATPAPHSAWKVAATEQLPACRFDQPAHEVAAMRGLPDQVKTEVLRFFKGDRGLAEVGADFNRTDEIEKGLPSRRFIRAYLVNDIWIIWYERGGFVYNVNTLALTRRGKASPYEATGGSGFTGDLCAGSKAFLAGARASFGM